MNTRDEIVMQEIADKTLSIGCLIKHYAYGPEYSGNQRTTPIIEITYDCELDKERYHLKNNGLCSFVDDFDGKLLKERIYGNSVSGTKIIGHPIYPHHILQYLGNKGLCSQCARNPDGSSYIYHIDDNMNGHYIPRDLSQDYLGQSEETKEAIFKLVNEVKDEPN